MSIEKIYTKCRTFPTEQSPSFNIFKKQSRCYSKLEQNGASNDWKIRLGNPI